MTLYGAQASGSVAVEATLTLLGQPYTLIWLLPVKRQDPVLCGADIELNLLPDGERDGA